MPKSQSIDPTNSNGQATGTANPASIATPPANPSNAPSPEAPIAEPLSQADRDHVMALLAQLREKLPFLRDLTAEERMSMPDMGDKNRAFVSKALEIAAQNPEFLPRSFDLEQMQATVTLFDRFYGISLALMQLHRLAEATVIAIGSEAYEDALAIYRYAKASGQGANLEALLAEMGERFSRPSSKPKPAEPKTTEERSS